MKKIVLLPGICLSVVTLFSFSCSSEAILTEKPTVEQALTREIQVTGKEPWQAEWDKALAQAKKERKVVGLGTVQAGTRDAIMDGFKEKYGIDMEYIVGRGGEISQKLITERRAGIFSFDFYIGGATTLINEIKPSGALEPLFPALILPEILEEKNWYGGKLPLMDKDKKIFAFMAYPTVDLAINTELVKEGEIKSLKDIIDPRWKGKILIQDPTIAGGGLGWFGRNIDRFGIDFMKKLAENKPALVRDQRLQLEWLARGRYPVTTNPSSEVTADFIKAGAPVKGLDLVEGALSTGSGHVSLLNSAPHPAGAKIFVNWLLSREGQTVYSRAQLQQSAREDIPVDHLDRGRVRKPGVDYWRESNEELLLKRPAQAKQAQEIFADLLK